MNNLNIIRTGNVVGILSVVFFFLCVAWGFLLTGPELKELHLNILRIIYPGYAISFIGIVAGIVAAFIYGWFFGALFAWLCRKACVGEENKSS